MNLTRILLLQRATKSYLEKSADKQTYTGTITNLQSGDKINSRKDYQTLEEAKKAAQNAINYINKNQEIPTAPTMTDYLHALPPGYRIEEYELVRVLGSGGFGITYLGYDHHLDKAVAIKEYLPNDLAVRTDNQSVLPKSTQDKADYEWGLERFLSEAQTLARFDHRQIIKIHRFFRAHGTGYIVMEYAEGETLSELLQCKGTLTEAELKSILFPILDGLEAVHEADFLHRDIKPGNIVIRDDGSPVLIDFGSARQAVAGKSRSVTAIVTPGYAPIEQYSAKGHQGPWTDIYGLGAVCYRCLTGEPPNDAMERLREDPLVPISKRCKGKANAELLDAIDRALRVYEGGRPQMVAEWREVLSGVTKASAYRRIKGIAKSTITRSPVSSPSQGSRDGLLSKLLLAGIILILVGLQFVYEDGKEEVERREVLPPTDKRITLTPLEPDPPARKRLILSPAEPMTFDSKDPDDHKRLILLPAEPMTFDFKDPEAGEMVSVPGGTFRMGDLSGEGIASEKPVHAVTIRPFKLGKYEVTFEQWDACVADGGCNGYLPDDKGWGRGNRPVINVSWDDVQSFIDWLNRKTGGNYRLPSGAEWEYAARAGSATLYSWGDDIGHNHANCDNDCGDSYQYAAPAGSFRANAWGLHDMHGNVWEWVQDCWNDSYEGAPSDGSAWESGDCGLRVFRGGSWFQEASLITSSIRDYGPRFGHGHLVGFRLAQDQ